MLHVGDAPRKLLRAVRGLTLIELPNQEQCCGFGGTFAVKNADVSAAMLTAKDSLRHAQTGANVVTALDNSCLMQIYGGLHRAGSEHPHHAPCGNPWLTRGAAMSVRIGKTSTAPKLPYRRREDGASTTRSFAAT